jgi:hypothetical protein
VPSPTGDVGLSEESDHFKLSRFISIRPNGLHVFSSTRNNKTNSKFAVFKFKNLKLDNRCVLIEGMNDFKIGKNHCNEVNNIYKEILI